MEGKEQRKKKKERREKEKRRKRKWERMLESTLQGYGQPSIICVEPRISLLDTKVGVQSGHQKFFKFPM